jgi:cbb3-type cytochrome oxidase subunit 3
MIMEPHVINVLAVCSILYLYRAYAFWTQRRERVVRERVAYMLWVAAQQAC